MIAGPFEPTPEGYTHFLLAVDLTDGWVEIVELTEVTSVQVIEKILRAVIASSGVPEGVVVSPFEARWCCPRTSLCLCRRCGRHR